MIEGIAAIRPRGVISALFRPLWIAANLAARMFLLAGLAILDTAWSFKPTRAGR
jgi:hypothetical protein